MSNLAQLIKNDKAYKQLRETTETITASVDHDKILREVKTLHNDRPSRNLYKIAMEPSKLFIASAQDMSHRSRMSELKVTLFQRMKSLEKIIEETEVHIGSKFQEEIRAKAKTAHERKTLIAKFLQTPLGALKDLSYSIEVIDIYIKDIDQASYSLQRCVEVVKMTVERKAQGL